MKNSDRFSAVLQTPLGSVTAEYTDDGIHALLFDEDSKPDDIVESYHPHVNTLKNELDKYFNGQLQEFTVPLVLEGTDFQQRVWKSLLEIPYGCTRNYAEQAVNVGDLKSIRAVARANGQNPVAILIPCHRIIGSDGSLTGYAGGIDRKRKLLLLEKEYRTEKLSSGQIDLF